MKKLVLIMTGALVLFASSCKKEKTTTELLQAGAWKMTAGTATNGASSLDFYATMPTCSKDDLYTFKTDNSLFVSEGASKCNSSDPDTYTYGTYSVVGDSLAINDSSTVVKFKIVSLDASQLKLSTGDGTTVTNYTYSH